MSHLALYRKYRPKTFKEVVGQEHVIKTLTNAIASNSVSHAYLFAGPRGTGKTTTARLLAKAVNCQNRKQGEYEPCNKCDSCLEINEGKAVDLIEIDAASNRGIDEIRELKEGIGFLPVKSKYKVFIIDEAHQLTGAAANALLKTLEEPPSHAIFILATTEAHKMIPTIISRCQRFDFRRLKAGEIIKRLEYILNKEKIEFEPEALSTIASSVGGCIRDAETLLDQSVSLSGKEMVLKKETVVELLGLADSEVIFKFLNFLVDNKAKEAINLLNKSIFQGIDIEEFLKSSIQYMREILFLKINNSLNTSITGEEKEKLNEMSKKLSTDKVKHILEQFALVEQNIKYAAIPQLPFELAIIDICNK